MDRLTEKAWANLDPWECCGQDGYCLRPSNKPGGCRQGCIVPKLYVRLAKYEDIGLTPEGVSAIKLALMGKSIAEIKEFDGISIDRLRELAKADRDGRLALLPCKPLDTVYSLFCGEIVEKRIGAITINGYTNPRIWVELYCDFLATQTKRWDLAVGKEFFLTREEAEAALKGDAK